MATQYAPIAKDSSINTTEQTPRNVADVLAQGLDAIEQAIAGGSGSGGHTIVNASGTDMTQRAKMQFVDAKVTDDAVNDVTKISTTPASYPSANVTYGSGSVEDALDELNLNIVSVTADGTKNERVLLNELFALVDLTKLNPQKSFIQTINTNGNYSVYRLNAVSFSYNFVGAAYFTMEQIVSNQLNVYLIFFTAGTSAVQAVEGGTFHDYSTDVESAGYKFVLYY